MNTVALAAMLGTFWGALAYLAGATLPHALALGVMAALAVVGLLGIVRAERRTRKRMFAAGKIGPKRKCITIETWNVELGGRQLYETTEQDSGASPWRAA